MEKLLFDNDERGTKEEFSKNFGNQPLGKFIRSLVGLEYDVVQEAFSDFLHNTTLSANQMKFIDTIIGYLTTNRTLEKRLLTQKPFSLIHEKGI